MNDNGGFFTVHAARLKSHMYRDEIYSLQILLSRTQAGPGRTVKQEEEEVSPNHIRRLNLISVPVIACYNTARCLTIDDATSAGCVSMHLTNISPHISIEFKMFD